MCNAVVDPASHLSACQYDQCYSANATTASCNAMEAYARECAKFGVCLAWRSDQLCPIQCPGGMEYRQCGSGCVTTCQNFKEESCVMTDVIVRKAKLSTKLWVAVYPPPSSYLATPMDTTQVT